MKNILLLEDEEILGGLYEKHLSDAGYKTIWVQTLGDLRNTIKSFKPDIAFLDQGIAGDDESGSDVIPEIKEISPKTKIIMLTNYSSFHLEEKAKKKGADGYLLKIDTPPAALVAYVKSQKK